VYQFVSGAYDLYMGSASGCGYFVHCSATIWVRIHGRDVFILSALIVAGKRQPAPAG